MNKSVLLLLVGIAAGQTGCSMAPKYTRPEAPVPAEWPAYEAAPPTANASDAALVGWQEFFADQKLQRIIAAALKNNRDLRLAALNVERARALYGVQRAELFPVFDASAIAGRERLPADLSGAGKPLTMNQFGASLGLTSWEIDFFGRIRSLADRALEEYMATEQARRGTQILLVSEVATAYLTLAADRETLNLARTTLEAQQAAYDLVKRRLDRGYVPELDLFRAQTQVDAARRDIARYTQQVAQDKNALDLLAGAPVPDDLLPAELGGVSPLKEISPGVSSEVLLSRPDIYEAEALLKAANANIGAARATLFPRISLTAAIGVGSTDLSHLFKSGSGAWNFTPQAVAPIFDARAWSALKVTEVDKQSAVAQYEKAIQTAFREVADALAVRSTVDQQVSAQESLVHAAAETHRLSSTRYVKGIDNYLSVLDAQQALYGAQQRLVAIRWGKLANQVRLYAVLGGGWQSEPAAPAESAAPAAPAAPATR